MTFVPFAALFEGASFTRAFATSARGFALNILPLLIFGALALVLVLVGLLSYGFGLIAVFPLLSAASYAAWKESTRLRRRRIGGNTSDKRLDDRTRHRRGAVLAADVRRPDPVLGKRTVDGVLQRGRRVEKTRLAVPFAQPLQHQDRR